ncbi:MAG: putative molybdenum carrier protein [Deltaproteobacteria bacterium]|nr:putative molybdenum carrier protein [Deltaproteobacteria bacterium]
MADITGNPATGCRVEKIVSGGQTGVDRAALDAALAWGVPCAGWCPAGRLAEDGPIDERYPLRETPGADYSERTERNVLDSDGTLILNVGTLDGGTAYTAKMAKRHGKPYLIVRIDEDADVREAVSWLARHHIVVMNIAGPRESKSAGTQERARGYLDRLIPLIITAR